MLLLTGCASPTLAQTRKESKLLEKAILAYDQGNFSIANSQFQDLLLFESIRTTSLKYLIEINKQQDKCDSTLHWIDRLLEVEPLTIPIGLSYVKSAWRCNRYAELITMFNQNPDIFRSNSIRFEKKMEVEKFYRDARFVLDYQEVSDTSEVPVMYSEINSINREYWPSFSILQNDILYTRLENNDENVWRYDLQSNTNEPAEWWNSNENEGAHCISADGQLFLFTGCNRRDGEGSCDIYYSVLRDAKWSVPENLGRNLNTSAWEGHPSISPDGQSIYFVSDRPGGIGGKDIWVMHYDSGARGWKSPVNLGSDINTTGDEEGVYLHFDDHHLYFMSTGHPGFGMRIFLSVVEMVTTGHHRSTLGAL